MDERFRKAEEEYFILRGKLDTGRIGKNLFELALRDMMVQDAEGRWWMLGPDTGNWYMHDGTKWIEADPSHVKVSGDVTSPAPKSSPGGSLAQGGGTPNRALLFGGIGCAALVCIAVAIAGAIGLFNAPLRPTSPTSIALGTVFIPLTTPTLSLPPIATATLMPIQTETPPSTATRVVRPTSTSLPSYPPSVYVLGMRIDPPQPKRRFDIIFHPIFLNTTGTTQNYRVVAYVYRPDQTSGRSMGETPPNTITIPNGTSENATLTWTLTGPGGCEDFYVRIAWWDELKNPTFFNLPTGQLFQIPMAVCP